MRSSPTAGALTHGWWPWVSVPLTGALTTTCRTARPLTGTGAPPRPRRRPARTWPCSRRSRLTATRRVRAGLASSCFTIFSAAAGNCGRRRQIRRPRLGRGCAEPFLHRYQGGLHHPDQPRDTVRRARTDHRNAGRCRAPPGQPPRRLGRSDRRSWVLYRRWSRTAPRHDQTRRYQSGRGQLRRRSRRGDTTKNTRDNAASTAQRVPALHVEGTKKVKQGLTYIVLVVDRSGSMSSIRGDMEGALATFLKEQREQPGEATITRGSGSPPDRPGEAADAPPDAGARPPGGAQTSVLRLKFITKLTPSLTSALPTCLRCSQAWREGDGRRPN
jgi:hypothetical protein